MSAHSFRLAAMGLLIVAGLGCGTADAGVTMEHGVREGTQIGEISLECGEATTTPIAPKLIAPKHDVQLITFSTPYDCSACAPHLAALDSLRRHGLLPQNDVMVIWSPGGNIGREANVVRNKSPRTVCVDQRGALWDRHDLQHTPITVLVVKGRVTYLNDRMLDGKAEHRAFLQDLVKYSTRN